MFDEAALSTIRRAYARQVALLGGAHDPALEDAFAEVGREAFLGNGPWQLLTSRGYVPTPNNDPAWLYADNLVGIEPDRGLNNGHPSSHATWITAAAPARGEHVVHIGAGVGYYSAILAHMVGPDGMVTAFEIDDFLAQRAAENLAAFPQVKMIHANGVAAPFAPADVIYVNAGTTHPAREWLDGLKEGGRLVLPLTVEPKSAAATSHRPGAVFCITRRGSAFNAAYVSSVSIFPCVGMRDDAAEKALIEAFRKGGQRNVRHFHWTDESPPENCWVKAPGWCLTYR